MSPEEKEVQRALGLLSDWIVLVKDRLEPLRRGYKHIDDYKYDNSHFIYVVVEAINHKHALSQVKQSNAFPKEDFHIYNGWSSSKAGAHYRKQYAQARRRGHYYPYTYSRPRIHIL